MQSKQSASNWYLSDEKHFSSGIVETGSPNDVVLETYEGKVTLAGR